jgi:hypothetical protein
MDGIEDAKDAWGLQTAIEPSGQSFEAVIVTQQVDEKSLTDAISDGLRAYTVGAQLVVQSEDRFLNPSSARAPL